MRSVMQSIRVVVRVFQIPKQEKCLLFVRLVPDDVNPRLMVASECIGRKLKHVVDFSHQVVDIQVDLV